MNNNFDFPENDPIPQDRIKKNKARTKKFISEEIHDQHKLNNQFKKKKKRLQEEESWEDWQD